VMARYRPAKT